MARRVLVTGLTIALLLVASGPARADLSRGGLSLRLPGTASGTASPAVGGPREAGNQARRSLDVTPVRLVIASIHLNARIEAKGLDAARNLDTAQSSNDVAWYDLGPVPGRPGNAIINGHVNWWTGQAVFSHLGNVRAGDMVEIVRANGDTVVFKVTSLRKVAAGARIPALFAPGAVSTLTLITCAGVWDPLMMSDTERLLVSATLV